MHLKVAEAEKHCSRAAFLNLYYPGGSLQIVFKSQGSPTKNCLHSQYNSPLAYTTFYKVYHSKVACGQLCSHKSKFPTLQGLALHGTGSSKTYFSPIAILYVCRKDDDTTVVYDSTLIQMIQQW